MDTHAVENPKQSDDDLRAGVTRRFVQVVTTVVVQTALLMTGYHDYSRAVPYRLLPGVW